MRFANSPLYRLLQDHWEIFLSVYEDQFQRRHGALRSVVERVVPRYLDCGNPMNGFTRIRCPDCGHERLLAFSCKCRGFCPSCQARHNTVCGVGYAGPPGGGVCEFLCLWALPVLTRARKGVWGFESEVMGWDEFAGDLFSHSGRTQFVHYARKIRAATIQAEIE